jgi:hypothetical protein
MLQQQQTSRRYPTNTADGHICATCGNATAIGPGGAGNNATEGQVILVSGGGDRVGAVCGFDCCCSSNSWQSPRMHGLGEPLGGICLLGLLHPPRAHEEQLEHVAIA